MLTFEFFFSDPTKKVGQKLVGDVDFEEAKKIASFITPVPGNSQSQFVETSLQF
jgi:Tetrahydrofolate dehydrogenase/cyclohydrolase, NAD(P)-binding domain